MISSVVALQTALASPWPARLCLAASSRSCSVCPPGFCMLWPGLASGQLSANREKRSGLRSGLRSEEELRPSILLWKSWDLSEPAPWQVAGLAGRTDWVQLTWQVVPGWPGLGLVNIQHGHTPPPLPTTQTSHYNTLEPGHITVHQLQLVHNIAQTFLVMLTVGDESSRRKLHLLRSSSGKNRCGNTTRKGVGSLTDWDWWCWGKIGWKIEGEFPVSTPGQATTSGNTAWTAFFHRETIRGIRIMLKDNLYNYILDPS